MGERGRYVGLLRGHVAERLVPLRIVTYRKSVVEKGTREVLPGARFDVSWIDVETSYPESKLRQLRPVFSRSLARLCALERELLVIRAHNPHLLGLIRICCVLEIETDLHLPLLRKI